MKTNLLSKVNLVLCGVMTFAALSASAQIEDVAAGRLSETFARAKTEKEIDSRSKKAIESIALKMNVKSSEVFDFFKEKSRNMTPAQNAAWTSLFNLAADVRGAKTKDDFAAIETAKSAISSFITLKTSKIGDNLSFNEVDLAKAQKEWTLTQKKKYAKVLREAVGIVQAGGVVTMDDAFIAAMKKEGIYDKYLEGCKR